MVVASARVAYPSPALLDCHVGVEGTLDRDLWSQERSRTR